MPSIFKRLFSEQCKQGGVSDPELKKEVLDRIKQRLIDFEIDLKEQESKIVSIKRGYK